MSAMVGLGEASRVADVWSRFYPNFVIIVVILSSSSSFTLPTTLMVSVPDFLMWGTYSVCANMGLELRPFTSFPSPLPLFSSVCL